MPPRGAVNQEHAFFHPGECCGAHQVARFGDSGVWTVMKSELA
jgi:hypothetical protein